jgi:hypothetical protein
LGIVLLTTKELLNGYLDRYKGKLGGRRRIREEREEVILLEVYTFDTLPALSPCFGCPSLFFPSLVFFFLCSQRFQL